MKIKKMYQGSVPENKIVSTYSNSQTDVYSCEYVNNIGGSGGEVDLSNYYNKTETEVLVDNKIAAIPEVDLTDYYTKEQSETMVDEKIEEIPVSDLLHYKGHLASVDNLPSAGQPSAPEVAPVLSVGTLKSTWTISDFNITKFKELLGSYKYLIGSGGLNMSSSLLTRARIFFNSSSVLDGCCPISDSYLALHFNASATQPVYVYGTTDIKTIYYDDGTTQDTTTTLTAITKPFWTRLTLNSTVGSSIIYTVNNLDFDIRLKFPPTSLGFLSEEYVTFKSTTLNRFYIEGYYLLTPVGLTAGTTSWFNYYAGEPSAEAVENNFYTVGDNYDIYVCDSSPAWKLWSESEKVDLSNYYNKEETNTIIDDKISEIPDVDLSDYFNKEETTTLIDDKIAEIPDVDLSNYYTKTQTDTVIDNKIDAIPETDLSNYYNKGEVDDLIENIPSSGGSVEINNEYNTSTTETYSCSYINNLSAGEGVDLSNYYTKTETDTAIDNKISAIPKTDLSNYYNKSETEDLVDNKISAIPETDLTNYYNKTETENLVNSSIEAIPETDLSSYYTKTETDTAIDNKIAAIPKTTDIVESGSNANGKYIKFADGTLICRKTHDFGNQEFSAMWGMLYETQRLDLGSFPVPFVGEYPEFYIMAWQPFFVERSYTSTLTSWGGFWALRPVSGNYDVKVSCFAIGKWK